MALDAFQELSPQERVFFFWFLKMTQEFTFLSERIKEKVKKGIRSELQNKNNGWRKRLITSIKKNQL